MATKKEAATETTAKKATGALESAGKAACRKYGLSKAYVTSDGAVFKQENDAKNHARNLEGKNVITVSA